MTTTAIQFTCPDDLLKRIDDFCAENYLKRSTVFCQGANLYMLQAQIPIYLKKMADSMEKIAADRKISEETKKDIDDLYSFAQMLGSNFN